MPERQFAFPLAFPPSLGGIQQCFVDVFPASGPSREELGKPVLVMRDTTERPEAVSAGTARLVGTDPDRVCSEVDQLLTCPRAYKTMANAVNPYGDGRAAQRTVEAIEHMFGLGSRPVPFGGTATGDDRYAADSPLPGIRYSASLLRAGRVRNATVTRAIAGWL